MNKKTKIIFLSIILGAILLIVVMSVGVYAIYKVGENRGYLDSQEQNSTTPSLNSNITTNDSSNNNSNNSNNKEEYYIEKQKLDQAEDALDLEEDKIEGMYLRKEITYQEYRSKKAEIERQEDELDRQEDELERKYGIDD